MQGHNFHDTGDEDWVRFSPLPDQTATIAIVNPGPNNQPVVTMYRAEDVLELGAGATPVRVEQSGLPGESLTFEHHFTDSEQYLLRVANADPSVSGQGTSYLLLVAMGTGGADLIPTTLIVSVVDSSVNHAANADVVQWPQGGKPTGTASARCRSAPTANTRSPASPGYITNTVNVRVTTSSRGQSS